MGALPPSLPATTRLAESLWQTAVAEHGQATVLSLPQPELSLSTRRTHPHAGTVSLPSFVPARYTLREALARLPAIHRARWLAFATTQQLSGMSRSGDEVELERE